MYLLSKLLLELILGQPIFSPVVSVSSLRSLFALAVMKGYAIIKFDLKTAFLCGEMQEDIFMKFPEGIKKAGRV